MNATINERVIKAIIRKAQEKGLNPNEYLIRLMENDLSIKERKELYLALHERYLSEAKDYTRKGNITQASEKYWGSVTTLLSAIAAVRDWRHYSHRDCSEIVEKLAIELKDPELPRLFAVTERLHANYYHGFIKPETFPTYGEDVRKILDKLRKVLSSSARYAL